MENKLQELLTITMEECGELIQACSKAIRCDDYYENRTREKLTEEVGDLYCMIELMHEYDIISWNDIRQIRNFCITDNFFTLLLEKINE